MQRGRHEWFHVAYKHSDKNGDNYNTAASEEHISDFAFGYDKLVGDLSVVGITFGISNVNYSVAKRWTEGVSTGANIGLYGMFSSPSNFYAKTMLSAGYFENDHTRFAMGHTVKGNYDTSVFGSKIELGFRNQYKSSIVTPFAAIAYDRLHQHSYQEDNHVWGNLVDTQSTESVPVSAGLEIKGLFKNETNGMIIKPSIKYTYTKEMQMDRSIVVSPLPCSCCKSTIDGAAPMEEFHRLEVGYSVQINHSLETSAHFEKRWSDEGDIFGGNLNVNYRF